MEAHEATAHGQKCLTKEIVKEKAPLERKWASEPTANTKQSTFSDPEVKHRESLPCGATGGSAPHQKYGIPGNSAKLLSGSSAVGAIGGPPSQDLQGPFAQGFQRGYFHLAQPYPQHPQSERFVSGAKPQPGLEPHAWPFVGQLPSDDLYPVGHPGHTHPHGAGRFPRQKSPSLPSSFGQYSHSGSDPGEEGYGKKEQKPKKPGKYLCPYCNRACAKPSVLKKHIRSHTGERPYPCIPCGFSFKTKSNLYKHRKSHAHAIKAGLVPFSSEPSVAPSGDTDQASPAGEAEVPSDGEQSTDTDEEGVETSTMLMDKDSPIPQISFEADKNGGSTEPAYADSAEDLPIGSMKVPILIFPKPGGVPPTGMECPPFHDIKGSHRMLGSQAGGRARSLDDSPNAKQRLGRKLIDKEGQNSDPGMSQSLNLLSPHSKGSTDSGYFSPFDSAELQIGTPNTNVKTYEEIMFGRTWYNRPNSRSRQSITVNLVGADPNTLVTLKQAGTLSDMGKIVEDPVSFTRNIPMCGEAKQYPTGPCQSSTGLLEPPSDSGTLIRSNSMPTPSPPNLSAPPGIRGSVSFDNMVAPDDVFYPPGHPRLRRQGAFEQSGNDAHIGEAEGYGHMAKNFVSSLGMKISERSPGVPENIAYSPYGTKVSMSEIATRKRRKEKSVGDDEDSPGHCDSSCSGSVEMMGDYEFKQGSFDGTRATPIGKGSLHSAHSQSDSFDTCPSMCSEDITLVPDLECRKATRNSVIQHTGIVSRPNSFEKSESFDQTGYQSADKGPSSQYSEQSDNDIFEDALSPESALLKSDSMDQQASCELVPLSSSSAAASPGQPYPNSQRLVRQPNIQVPEIRVTEEPDKPEKDTEAPASKEPERQQQHVEEFQLPQRSDTLSQMPTEKLPPKKKRLRLADMEHSSGESSFESTCTSLSRSPSQESNLSHSSSLSMSFDRDEGPKSVSPTKQDDSMASGGAKQSEFLTVPGSGYSSHHQQREMRRSSSEQAPCTLPTELPEMRSKSFDYGNLPSSRQGEMYTSASAMKERRRGYLVRQASLSVYPETVLQEAVAPEISIKQENVEHGIWASPTGSPHSSIDLPSRTKRPASSTTGLGSHQQYQQHSLQQSISEDSLQDEPVYGRLQQHRLQAQSSSSEGEHPGLEAMSKDLPPQYQNAAPLISISQPGLFWSQESEQRQQQTLQAQQQLLKLHIRSQGSLAGHPQTYDGKPDGSQIYSSSISGRNQQQQSLGPLSSKHSLPGSTAALLLPQVQPVFATQNPGSQASLPGLLVPVRIQTNVPSFGNAMYTSVSQLIASYGCGVQALDSDGGGTPNMSPPLVNIGQPAGGVGGGMSGAGFNLSLLLGQVDVAGLRFPPPEQQVNTGIPLSLTSGTISTTDASASNMVASKRMLSPTSSLERFFETKQQKRVKEERMYGQIVKEMGAVELSGAERTSKKLGRCLKTEESVDDSERMSSSPPISDFPVAAKIAIPVRSPAPHLSDVPRVESFTPPLQIITDRSPAPGGRDSPEELDVDEAPPRCGSSPEPMFSSNDTEDAEKQPTTPKLFGEAGAQQLFQFPSLRTMSRVSWCFRSYTKPNSTPAAAHSSVYSSWCVSSYNPNPLHLSTKAALALLRSKQKTNTDLMYTVAAMAPPSSGKLVSSVAWKLRFDQLKPELMPVDVSHFGRKMKGVASWDRSKEEQVEKEVSVKQPAAEPTRIKIFEGGYKSNEDYVYVRGRGRGKYICEECGIRCKKPSMLKKHIRTHTDVRPYVCKFCNFAFKTKGNLTKHMKSKAHMKKCLELGVSMSSVEDGEADDGELGEEGQRSSEKPSRGVVAEHQFSDADESDGGEDDGDEVDDEDEDEDDYDGDSTPKTRSRSTSPQPYALPSMSITAVAATPQLPHQGAPDLLGPSSRPPLFGYFTTVPSIQITPQAPPPERAPAEHHRSPERSRLLAPPSSSMDEDLPVPSPDLSSPSSRLSSPGLDLSGCPSPGSPSSSPSTCHYLSPRRDLSPHAGHLSPRRDISPLRHISPKRDLGVGGYRRDLSPRRGHLSVLSPLSRPASPGGRDYKRDLSPRGRHRGMIRPLSPRRGLYHQSPHSGARSPRANHQMGVAAQGDIPLGRRSTTAEMEKDLRPGSSSPSERDHGSARCFQSGPPHQVLFSHLPTHSQLQVRSPFPMIPIGGIQMVHSVPTSATTPLGQQGAPAAAERGQRGGERLEGGGVRPEGGGVRPEQEESIHTCTKAIASLCLDPECVGRGGGGGGRAASSAQCPDSHQQQQQRCSSPPPPGIQHFSGLELRPSSSSSSSPAPLPPSPVMEEKEAEKKDAS
ncbi:transcription factor HIVEP2a isoform X1 [Poecilia latipinna]|uniref:HIVEP zinc finger 2a n=1 Tax=Poecilia latipinna TaxID=48699 RepID=A0A3B3W0D5_9TELE|nr:PREDICTED: transcription factor HIVEP2 isoform X1 [Poecilia latipinna]XP_014902125.1 PREDICTED: transcription factor HIVEP2 isoform X1 [Poecilia latipinna]XP_014902127.1 PREDICTED: transcription factor HIVEP2 isoform X1 [Poecilia latipinna]XP_014902128.1 PREDICTED: transcription factor HIVEP2 isoform X1 [Poecilia latipinna]